MTSIPNYAPAQSKPSVFERINLRMIVFVAVVIGLVGFPVYIYLQSAITGGIRDVGGGFKECDLKAMSLFTFDQNSGKDEDVPQKWRALDGQKVVLYGEIWDSHDASDGRMMNFQLCYSIAKCCFQGPPQVQHFVKVTASPDKSPVYYAPNLVRVTGVLHVKVVQDKEAGKVKEVYSLDVDDVRPA
jgi:hypothetical protein